MRGWRPKEVETGQEPDLVTEKQKQEHAVLGCLEVDSLLLKVRLKIEGLLTYCILSPILERKQIYFLVDSRIGRSLLPISIFFPFSQNPNTQLCFQLPALHIEARSNSTWQSLCVSGVPASRSDGHLIRLQRSPPTPSAKRGEQCINFMGKCKKMANPQLAALQFGLELPNGFSQNDLSPSHRAGAETSYKAKEKCFARCDKSMSKDQNPFNCNSQSEPLVLFLVRYGDQ